jgi:hypothetical protein
VLIGTSTFTAKARAELRTWGLPDERYLEVPHGYQELDAARFTALVSRVAQDIAGMIGQGA